MQPTGYTVARWRVTPGQEDAFRTAWVALVETLARLERPPLCGTLLQHRTDTTLFFSFGPWDDARDIEAFCHDPAGQDAFLRVMELCVEAEPGVFRLVERIECWTRPSAEADVSVAGGTAHAGADGAADGNADGAASVPRKPRVRRAVRRPETIRRTVRDPDTPP